MRRLRAVVKTGTGRILRGLAWVFLLARVAAIHASAACDFSTITLDLSASGTVLTADHQLVHCDSAPAAVVVNVFSSAPGTTNVIVYDDGPTFIGVRLVESTGSVFGGAADPGFSVLGTFVGIPVGAGLTYTFTFGSVGRYDFTAADFVGPFQQGPGVINNAEPFTVIVSPSKKLSLTLDESTIEPSPSHLEQNLVRVSVAVADAAGDPMPNVGVTLKAEPVDLVVAGHDHAGSGPGLLNNLASAPAGSFEDIATRQPVQGCTTGADGTCQVFYVVDVVSGVYKITAALSSDSSVSASQGLTVRGGGFVGLVPLNEDPRYALVGQFGTDAVTSQHTINHFGTISLNIRIAITAAFYFAETGGILGINDMSLAWGGLFDIGNRWSPPHNLHRTGMSVDINRSDVNDSRPVDRRRLDDITRLSLRRIPEGSKIHYEVVP